jgi:crossover junction endodeoxyribonuclease RuvC
MILGIDPGINIVGFAFVEGTKKNPIIVDYGILHTEKQERNKTHLRILEIAQDLESLIIKYVPTKAVIEDLFFFKNAKTVISVAQARGVMLYLLAKHNVEVISVTPLQVKQTLTGYGRADKKQVQKMIQKIFELDELPKQDDAADALGMAWLGL